MPRSKDGIQSYFQPNYVSKQDARHRNFRATLIEDVILGFLYANPGKSRPARSSHDAGEACRDR